MQMVLGAGGGGGDRATMFNFWGKFLRQVGKGGKQEIPTSSGLFGNPIQVCWKTHDECPLHMLWLSWHRGVHIQEGIIVGQDCRENHHSIHMETFLSANYISVVYVV